MLRLREFSAERGWLERRCSIAFCYIYHAWLPWVGHHVARRVAQDAIYRYASPRIGHV